MEAPQIPGLFYNLLLCAVCIICRGVVSQYRQSISLLPSVHYFWLLSFFFLYQDRTVPKLHSSSFYLLVASASHHIDEKFHNSPLSRFLVITPRGITYVFSYIIEHMDQGAYYAACFRLFWIFNLLLFRLHYYFNSDISFSTSSSPIFSSLYSVQLSVIFFLTCCSLFNYFRLPHYSLLQIFTAMTVWCVSSIFACHRSFIGTGFEASAEEQSLNSDAAVTAFLSMERNGTKFCIYSLWELQTFQQTTCWPK